TAETSGSKWSGNQQYSPRRSGAAFYLPASQVCSRRSRQPVLRRVALRHALPPELARQTPGSPGLPLRRRDLLSTDYPLRKTSINGSPDADALRCAHAGTLLHIVESELY